MMAKVICYLEFRILNIIEWHKSHYSSNISAWSLNQNLPCHSLPANLQSTAACDCSGGIQYSLRQPGNLRPLHNQLIAKYLLFCGMCISHFKKLRQGSQAVRGHKKRKTVKIENTKQSNTSDVNVICLQNDEPKNCPGELASAE